MGNRICVAGVGAIGGLIAAMLGKKYADDLSLIARGERARALRENGLALHSDVYGEQFLRPRAVAEQAAALGRQDIVFVCVKNYSLSEIIENLRPAVGEDTILVPVMNGVEAGGKLRAAFPGATVCDSLIYTITGANPGGRVTQTGPYTYLFIGGRPGEEKSIAAAERVYALLRSVDFDARLTDDIEGEIWRKFVLNCAFNTVTARYLTNNAGIRGSAQLRADTMALLNEAARAGIAEGVNLPADRPEERFSVIMNVQKPDATSSMKRDVEAGRPTEVDAFTGTVLRLSEKHGLPAPVTARYHRELMEMCGQPAS